MQTTENPGRERILARIRSALRTQASTRHSEPVGDIFPPIPDALDRFRRECEANKTECIVTKDLAQTEEKLNELVASLPNGEIFVQDAPLLRHMAASWSQRRIRWSGEGVPSEATRAAITLVESLVAATGSVLVSASCGGRGASIMAPVHVVVASIHQLVPTLDTAFAWMNARGTAKQNSMVTLVTGPSRTGDIEKIIVLGAHGPQRLVVLLAQDDLLVSADGLSAGPTPDC